MKTITVLSLFDGMACGHIAMQQAGLEVERYDAYEIDKYAVQVASHNFPDIQQHGDVFAADFTQYDGVDFVIGGSPCTYWSIAQKNNRETEASGLGWELFSQYVRAIKEAKPKFFIYENNKSMSKQIRASICETFGFDAVGINSALVSAQNRQRLYWVGKRNEDGTYSKVHVDMPEDRGILLRDILESGISCRNDKAYCRDANYYKGGNLSRYNSQSGMRLQVAEPVNVTEDGKSQTLKAQYAKNSASNFVCYTSTYGASGVAEPIRIGSLPRPNGELSDSQAMRIYSVDGKSVTQSAGGGGMGGKTGLYAVSCEPLTQTKEGKSFAITANYRNISDYPNDYAAHSIEKSVKPVVAVPYKGQETPSKIYEVRDGKITIKGKQYPIKLADGFYIIRKLTVRECMRLQTVPEWYDFSVISNSQAYKCLGNGWTVDVIVHLIQSAMKEQVEVSEKQLLLF